MKRKILLFAAILPCIVFAISVALAFKPASGKPVMETSVTPTYDDSDYYYDALEQDLQDIAYDTWVNDGMPGEDVSVKTANHYCCKSSPENTLMTRQDRLDWLTQVMGPGNSNHVHYIRLDSYQIGFGGPIMYTAKVKYWTSEPCAELCNW